MQQSDIQQLVKELGGIRKAGREVGVPPSTLCEYLKGVYKGSPQRVTRVFEQYIKQIECPVLGRISKEQCAKWCNKPFMATNSFNAKMYKACRGCLQRVCSKK